MFLLGRPFIVPQHGIMVVLMNNYVNIDILMLYLVRNRMLVSLRGGGVN
jgi:hypothetical protein